MTRLLRIFALVGLLMGGLVVPPQLQAQFPTKKGAKAKFRPAEKAAAEKPSADKSTADKPDGS